MNRRELIKTLGLTSVGIFVNPFKNSNLIFAQTNNSRLKNWAWLSPEIRLSSDEWKRKFSKLKKSGIDAILLEVFNNKLAFYGSNHLPVGDNLLERVIPIAKDEGLELHAWVVTMVCDVEKIYKEHPEWYMVNGNGESCIDKPAYVDWYKFLCPSRIEVHEFLAERFRELAKYEGLAGIHLDYIRYPDVIIAEALQPKYGISQDCELPQYDYCYCDVCRKSFENQTNLDPYKLDDPSANIQWRQFRYNQISNLVNNVIVPIARENKKEITAAVFPPYNYLRVRQRFGDWNIDAVLPMLYHSFYFQGIEWIKNQTEKAVYMVRKGEPVYSGLLAAEFSPSALGKAVNSAIAGGASGIVLFPGSEIPDEHLNVLQKIIGK